LLKGERRPVAHVVGHLQNLGLTLFNTVTGVVDGDAHAFVGCVVVPKNAAAVVFFGFIDKLALGLEGNSDLVDLVS
jgi:hypothetical protein